MGGLLGGLTLDFRPTLLVVILRKICFIFGEERGGVLGILWGILIDLQIGVYFHSRAYIFLKN